MIRRIILKNFMSHEETVIELADGVTVLTGPNNTGKSAVVEALRCIVENPPSKELIRHGAQKAEVAVELDSGETIVWERTYTYPLYKIIKGNIEESYKKIGSGRDSVPDDTVNALRISPIETGDNEQVNVHIAPQKDPIFIPSGSKAASFFAASTEAHYLVQMQQKLKAKTDAKKERKKQIEQEQQKLKKLIEIYSPLDSIEEDFKQVDELEKEVKTLEERIPSLSNDIEKLESIISEIEILSAQKDLLEDLHEPPQIADPAPLEALIEEMGKTEQHIALLNQAKTALSFLQTPPELQPVETLAELVDKLDQTSSAVDRLRKISETLAALEDSPPIHPVQELSNTIKEYERLEKAREKLSLMSSILESIKPAPELNDTASLESLIGDMELSMQVISFLKHYQHSLSTLTPPPELKSLQEIEALATIIDQIEDMEKRVEKGKAYYADIEKAWKEKRRQIENRLNEIRICPLCNQPINVEHFLSELVENPKHSGSEGSPACHPER